MTRKAAILTMLGLPLALAQNQSPPPPDGKFEFEIRNASASVVGIEVVSIKTIEIRDMIEGDHVMLEVHADGRVAKFTAKEIMDALGGEWEKPDQP